jgi:hypothetical protein
VTQVVLQGTADGGLEATIELLQVEAVRKLTSADEDFVRYCSSIHHSLDEHGERILRRYADNNRYWHESERLTVRGKDQRKAVGDRVNRKETIGKGLKPLLIDYLKTRDWGAPRFLQLKERFFELEFSVILGAQMLMESQKKLLKKYPEAKGYSDELEKLLNVVWNADPTLMKRALRFFGFAQLDIEDVIVKAAGQLEHVDDLAGMLAQRKGLRADKGVPYIIESYRRLAESIRPLIETVDEAVRIAENGPKASPNEGYLKRVDYIKTTRWAPIVKCLDPNIRHADSHNAVDIDQANARVILTNTDGTKTEYSYQQITSMMNELQRGLFPALLGVFGVHETGLLATTVVSQEFLSAVLSIDNLAD